MNIIRPATPGFLLTLAATVLLALASFSVPLIQSIYFLKASLEVENVNGYITFGTLGYCTDISGNTTCSKATVGYTFNPNELVGDNTVIQIPDIVVQWLTYVLVLHIVAFGLAAISAFFGLLAHVREMAMTCFSSCISGFAAVVALAAFVFDIALFFIAKSRMDDVSGGSASIGNAVWITLAAWLLLFFSGCFYSVGRCCLRRRSRNEWQNGGPTAGNAYAEQMRLDAVKAEADRKARQNQAEGGLPAFQEYDPSQPLKGRIEGDEVIVDEDDVPYRDAGDVDAGAYGYGRRPSGYTTNGYLRAPPGTRAVDDFNNPSYPPQAQRQPSIHTQSSGYTSTNFAGAGAGAAAVAALAKTTPSPRAQYPPANSYYNQNPYSSQAYGHVAQPYDTSPHQQYPSAQPQQYSSAQSQPYTSAHTRQYPLAQSQQYPSAQAQQYPSAQSQQYPSVPSQQYNNISSPQPQYGNASYDLDTYTTAAVGAYTPTSPPLQQGRSYTLGGGGYEPNVTSTGSRPAQDESSYFPASHQTRSPPPLNTSSSPTPANYSTGSPVGRPRGPRTSLIVSPAQQETRSSPPAYRSDADASEW